MDKRKFRAKVTRVHQANLRRARINQAIKEALMPGILDSLYSEPLLYRLITRGEAIVKYGTGKVMD